MSGDDAGPPVDTPEVGAGGGAAGGIAAGEGEGRATGDEEPRSLAELALDRAATAGEGSGVDSTLAAAFGTGLAVWTLLSSVLLVVTGFVVGLALILAAIAGVAVAGGELTPLVQLVLSLVLLQGVAFGGVALGYIAVRGEVYDRGRSRAESAIGTRLGDTAHDLDWVGIRLPGLRDLTAVGVGYVVALGFVVVASILASTLGLEGGQNAAEQLAREDPTVLFLLVPASILVIGPGEELLFRGIVQNRLRDGFVTAARLVLRAVAPARDPARLADLVAPATAITVASLIFAPVHYFSLSGSPEQRLVSITILVGPALVFGAVYELTDNLVVPSLVHGLYNATLFTLLYFVIQSGSAAAV